MTDATFKYVEFIVGSGYVLDIPYGQPDADMRPTWAKFTREEAIALHDQIHKALTDGMLAERTKKFAPFGLAEDDRVAITDSFRRILSQSEYARYGADVWERASTTGELTISFYLPSGQDHLADAVGIYNPYFGKSIYVKPELAQAMKAAYVPPEAEHVR